MNRDFIRSTVQKMAANQCLPDERKSFCNTVWNADQNSMAPLLLELLDDNNTKVAAEAIGLLLNTKYAEHYLDAMLIKLDGSDNDICMTVSYELARLPYFGPRVIDPLSKIVKASGSADIRYWAIVALEKSNDKRVLSVLEWCKEHDSGRTYEGDSVSDRAASAMASILQN